MLKISEIRNIEKVKHILFYNHRKKPNGKILYGI